jgi:Ca2+-binding RTX toxin-like protein
MTLQIITSNLVGAGIQVNVVDDAFIAAGVTVVSTTATAIAGNGSGHVVDVEGTVVGLSSAIGLGATLADTDQHLIIGSNGYVDGETFGNAAVYVWGGRSTVDNHGTIRGPGFALAVGGSDPTGTSTVNNTGLIEGGAGIERLIGATGVIVVHNSGEIRATIGGGYSYQGDAGDARDIIENSGIMHGSVILGAGDDSYDGSNGVIDAFVGGTNIGFVDGGLGLDVLKGGAASDHLIGGDGNDVLFGGAGADKLFGDADDDEIHGGADGDTISGGSGADTLFGDAGKDELEGGAQADKLFGGDGDDDLDGGAQADVMFAGAGNDRYHVDDAGDVVDESTGSGFDFVLSSVSFNLSDTAHARGVIEVLGLTGNVAINATGNATGNRIGGNGSSNTLKGLAGDDFLFGGNGADKLHGGRGNDMLVGGPGADKFVFDTVLNAKTNLDTVDDFTHGVDRLWLDNSVFKALGAAGGLKAAFFHLGTAAHDANDHVIYDKATGALYYDRDGTGAHAQVEFAVLDSKPVLTAHDFLVI